MNKYDPEDYVILDDEIYDEFYYMIMASTSDVLEYVEHDFRTWHDMKIDRFLYNYEDMVGMIYCVYENAIAREDYELCAKIKPIIKPMFAKLDLIEKTNIQL